MKKIFKVFGFILLLASCEKKYEPNTKPEYDLIMLGNNNIMDSLTTINVVDSDSVLFSVYFSLVTGDPANDVATGSISGLPKGISVSQISHSAGLPFDLMPNLTAECDTGTYTFDVNLKTASKGLQTYPVKLHVLPPLNDANCMVGTWKSTGCGGTGSCVSTITAIDSMRHWAIIKNVSCLGDSIAVYAYFSQKTGIFIPKQTSHGYMIYGRFSQCPCGFQAATISIPDTIIHNGDTQNCYLYLSSQ